MELDPASLIVAVTGLLATIFGVRQARQGRHDAMLQQQAANRLAEEKLQLEALQATIPELRIEVDRALRARDEARAAEDAAYRARDARRSEVIESRTALSLAEEQTRRALSDLAALRMIVLDEVARAATDDAWEQPRPRPSQPRADEQPDLD